MLELHEKKLKFLEEMANRLREDVIKYVSAAGSGHVAGPLDMADIFAAFYFHILNHNPKNPGWQNRDRLVLSNGHICPVQYAALARAGYFPHEELKTLRQLGSRLQGHPHRKVLPGIETTSGPLGSGISQAIGMALAAKYGISISSSIPNPPTLTLRLGNCAAPEYGRARSRIPRRACRAAGCRAAPRHG